jgi:hypothetical protein
MDIAAWLARATADADARGLPELKPLLETLARSTQSLRDADGEFHHPAADHGATEVTDQGATEHTERTDQGATDHTDHTEHDKASE